MIAVVGGGLIGACIAFELHQAGEDVLVFDADLPGAAWRAGAGLLCPSGEKLDGTPLEADANESLRLWPDFARRLEASSGQSIGFREGLFRVAFDEEEARVLNAESDGEAVVLNGNENGTRVAGAEASGEAPVVNADSHAKVKAFPHLSAARFHASEGRVHPPSVRNAALHGLPIQRARVERIEPTEKGVVLQTDGEAIEARIAVLACGAWSDRFGLPVRAVQGQALLLDAPPDLPALYGPPRIGSSQYALGRPDGLYVGATIRDTGAHETSPDADAACSLRATARRLLGDAANAPQLQHLVGFRPTTPDGLPLVGRHPTLANVLVATGHSRHGVLLAPLTARRVLQHVRELLGASSLRVERESETRPVQKVEQQNQTRLMQEVGR
jgi:glycine oxidase